MSASGRSPSPSGPLRVRGRVRANEAAGAYRVLTVDAPGIPDRFHPGQFVTFAVGGEDTSMLGRRAFSIHDAGGETISVVVAAHGAGTTWLASLGAGEPLDVVGPLGRGFAMPARHGREGSSPGPGGARHVLVGGGYGSAPLFSLADALLSHGHRVDFVLGAATGDRLFGVDRARRTTPSTAVTTVDGSAGRRGVVTDALHELLGRSGDARDASGAAVYACGPMPMLRAVTAVAAEWGASTEVAVEESMACGIGVCMTCVLPVVGDDGRTRMTRSCVEGPVFSGDSVRWPDVGTIPGDVVGAPR